MSNRPATVVIMAILLIVFAGGTSASGEASGTVETPEDVFRQYFEALQTGDYPTCAALIHPDSIAPVLELLDDLLSSPDSEDVLEMFFGTNDPLKLGEYSDIELAALFLEATFGQDPRVEAIMADTHFSIVGAVYEGTDLVHIVYRAIADINGVSISTADIVTLWREEDAWQLILSDETPATIISLKGLL